MKKTIFSVLLIIFAVAVQATELFPFFGVPKPDVGSNARIKIVGQNCKNYFVYHLSHSNVESEANTAEGVQDKTSKIVNSFRYLDADIFAMVELEQSDSVLIYLTNALNAAAGSQVYDYVHDNISDCSGDDDGYGDIMAGFIYKIASVTPVGADFALATSNTYIPRMRGQFFKENSTNEMFLLAMNHFKAMSGTSAQNTRVTNASQMLSAISAHSSTDPDVLVMGDLNAQTSEQCIQNIIAAGYTEMLEYYDANAYSYIYAGSNELIDHCLANTSMQSQVTGAGVFHVNTGNTKYGTCWYSDHDPVLVGLALSGGSGSGEQGGDNPEEPEEPGGDDSGETISGCGIDTTFNLCDELGGFTAYDLAGSGYWKCSSYYGAQLSARSAAEDDWLVSPEIDLSGNDSAFITINHNVYYDNGTSGDYTEDQTLWYTTSWTGDASTTSWAQLVIPTYAVKSYVDAKVQIPAAGLKSGFRFAFHTVSDDPAVDEGNYWEIRTAAVKSYCTAEQPEDSTAMADILAEEPILIIYSLTGQPLGTDASSLDAGIYIVRYATSSEKLIIR